MDKIENLGEIFLGHYEKYLGDFFERIVYRKNDEWPAIQLLKYRNVFEGCITYATLGVSHYREVLKNNCEIVMVVDDSFDECANLLANALFYVIERQFEFGRGIVIGGIENINKEFASRCHKSALYFTETYSFPDDFSYISDDKIGKIYMAFLISNSEHEFINEKGADKFEELLEASECDIFDVNRESIIE